MAPSLDELIQRADLDGLVRHVDDACSARDWEHVLRIRNEARAAVKTGRQLWPIATLANYRLALWAPAELAVRALDDTARTFMPGPVSEILAVHHTWEQLQPYLPLDHDRSLVAYERALRRDVIPPSEEHALEIPFALAEWEPEYATATYNDDGVVDDMPPLGARWHSVDTRESDPLDDNTVHAFTRMMEPWTAHSNGSAHAVVVEGELEDALGALELSHAQFSELTPHTALQWLTWAASSGGAHGKRRGVATGRSEALWLLATFTGLDDTWPRSFTELGDVITNQLEFFAFTADKHSAQGWWLQLAVVDPNEGLTAAFIARDSLST
jgi:hypothetical protein